MLFCGQDLVEILCVPTEFRFRLFALSLKNPVLVIFTFETFSVKKELELSRKRTQKMRISEAQKYQLVESLIVVLFPVGNVDKAQDIT